MPNVPNHRAFQSLALGAAALAALATGGSALASGIMEMPPISETLKSHRVCLARLEAAQTADRRQVAPPVELPDGQIREVTVEDKSGGIKSLGRQHARYEARVWYHNGRARADLGKIETSHSWNGQLLECRGKVLTTTNSNGFTLSTFDDAPAAGTE